MYQSGHVVVIIHFNRFGGPLSFDSKRRCRLDPKAHVTLFRARGPLESRSARSVVKVKGRLLATTAPPLESMATRNQSLARLGL